MLDVQLFRTDQGGDPELVRESQRRRYADVGLVDTVIDYDSQWRQTRGQLDVAKKELRLTQKAIGEYFKKKETPPDELTAEKKAHEDKIAEIEAKEKELIALRDETIGKIGNLVPDDVPVHDDEEHNEVVESWGEFTREEGMLSHYDLVQMAGLANTVRGSEVAGSRGYFLTEMGVLLNQALISYAMRFLTGKGYSLLQTPFVMNKSLMGRVAQLADFDEQLYKVTGAAEDQYLIATSEQPICVYHKDDWLSGSQLPIKYAGYSTCFRKEAGSHGRDQLGIFRVHQFEKIEQFCITSPEGRESWDMQELMIKNSSEFYKSLGIPYRVVNIVSGELNDAAAKKYDLEAWFPGSNAHRELVSCSNCTDYQSRRLEVRYGQSKTDDGKKRYVHMLNSTLIATERAMCCVIENYQTETGIKVPEVLQEYMGGVSFIPFVNPPPKPAKGKTAKQRVMSKAEIDEMEAGKKELQSYMDAIIPTLNSALNTIARERPADPAEALAALLRAAGPIGSAESAGSSSTPDGDVEYAAALKQHITAALNDILAKLPEDPFKAMQKFLFQASLGDGIPPTVAPVAQTTEMSEYMAKYDMETHIADVIAKKGKGSGPVGGCKFMISDAGDVFTELSKKLKAGGGVPMTAEELKAMDAAAAKAKREKDAREAAERDAKDEENAKKSAAMEAEGKKVSGGLHKFDASEVDIDGGAGDADDFMDAFGF